MDPVREVQVLRAAVDWFEGDPERFTPDTYLRMGDSHAEEAPGRAVVQACAIGGIEQAIWVVTGKNVTGDRGRLAYVGRDGDRKTPEELDEQHEVYWRVMRRLNLEAVRRRESGLYAEFEVKGHEILDVEDVTEFGEEAYDEMMGVFRAALAAAQEETLVPA